MNGIKRFALRAVLVGSLAASAIGIGAGTASAATIRSDGCVEWNSTDGCVVKQYCSVDTADRTWSCITFDTRTKTGVSQNGVY